ncbi:MAG: hypothetical protein RI977_216 [Bacteroidota bacterium]
MVNPRFTMFKQVVCTMKPQQFVLLVISLMARLCLAQFAPAAGQPGSTALRADSSCFTNWAKRCSIQRGLRQINLPDSGFANVGTAAGAEGPAASNGVVSLGDGGIATLTFDPPITNGTGFDFAVFENTFLDTFLELAFVEVSTDSLSWARFPAKSLTQTNTQTPGFGFTQPTKINNLAGKYRHPYGTPFDLEELAMMSNIRINEIRYVRIIDVIGSIDSTIGSKDSEGRLINDPWPTPFPSSGFDLDAVGVINQLPNLNTQITRLTAPFWFQQESETLMVRANKPGTIEIFNLRGQCVYQQPIKTQPEPSSNQIEPNAATIEIPLLLSSGSYIARFNDYSIKIIITSKR